jgi:hypothetical protein
MMAQKRSIATRRSAPVWRGAEVVGRDGLRTTERGYQKTDASGAFAGFRERRWAAEAGKAAGVRSAVSAAA